MKKHTKNIKLYFNRPLNYTWDELGTVLNKLSWQFSKILNYGMTEYWMYRVEIEKWKAEKGKYPANKELKDPVYHKIKKYINENYEYFPSYSINCISMFLTKKWKADYKDVFYYNEKSLSTFKKGFPILCNNQQYKLIKTEKNGYVLSVGLVNRQWYKDNNKKNIPFKIQLKTKKLNSSTKAILDRIISGEYTPGEIKIKKDKKKKEWVVNIAYSFYIKEENIDPDKIVGVDLGIVTSFACAVNGSEDRILGEDGHELENFRNQISKRRKSIQNQSRTSNRKGRGRGHILRPIEKLQKKVDNFRDNKYHLYTKQIVEFALKHKAGTIQMEDTKELDKLKEKNYILKDWATYDFKMKLKNKCDEHGITLKEIDPRYTSQRCYNCGQIRKKNRIETKYKCKNCGYKEHADYNAARNISLPDIEEIITDKKERGEIEN